MWSTGSRHVGLSSCYSPALELGLSGCGAWAYLLCGMWDLPGPGMEPESPALAIRFLFTVPRGKSKQLIFVSVSLKYNSFTLLCEGFPGGSDGKKICLQCRRPWLDSWVRKILWRRKRLPNPVFFSFPVGSAGKESTCNVGDLGSSPRMGQASGERNSYSLQYSGLENSMDYMVHGVTKSQT